MSPTPDEIRSREFHLADRGYDRAEVRAFLAELAEQGESGSGTPWPDAEERLALILEAAARAVESVRAEASKAIRELREAAGVLGEAASPAVLPPPAPPIAEPDPAADVAEVRERLTAALRDVETALGAIEPGAQGSEPSTRPSS